MIHRSPRGVHTPIHGHAGMKTSGAGVTSRNSSLSTPLDDYYYYDVVFLSL